MNSLLVFFTFFKIGAFSFGGGYAVLPLIQKYVVEVNNWMTMDQMTDLVSLSQVTPGPIAINAATFVGTKLGGLAGAIIATLGEITPSCILMLLLGHLFFKGKKISVLDNILKGLKPAVAALILIAGISMLKSSLVVDKTSLNAYTESSHFILDSINILGFSGFIFATILYKFAKQSVIKTLLYSACLGFILHFALQFI